MSLQAPQPQSEPSIQATIVAVVDADPNSRQQARRMLESAGYRVVEYGDGQSAIRGNGKVPTVYCIDLSLPDVAGVEVVQQLRARDPELSLLAVTTTPASDAVSAARVAGAYDTVTKPWEEDAFLHTVRRACERRSLVCGMRRLESELRERAAVSTLVGDSPPMRELARQVVRVGDEDSAVCIVGERGTGKELAARAIHAASRRKCSPLVVLNCAAVPTERHATELFGPAAGGSRIGRVDEARGGILYLDEVQELSPAAQTALLRLVRDRDANVRVVCGTSEDLSSAVAAGRFDAALHAALSSDLIQVAPLRQRREDIPVLVGHYLRSQGKRGESPRVSPEVLEAFSRHAWPGNVRELQDVVVRSLLACRGDEITLADIPAEIRRLATDASALPELNTDVDADAPPSSKRVIPLRELERRAIEAALKATRGSVGKAAKLLGIGRATLYRRLAALELQRRPEPRTDS